MTDDKEIMAYLAAMFETERDKVKCLVACEESGAVREAINQHVDYAVAVSCDIQPTSKLGGQHFQCDVLKLLEWPWDLVIAHPPCTYLCNSGVCWIYYPSTRTVNPQRWSNMMCGAAFFRKFQTETRHVPHVAIENPIPHGFARGIIGKYTQIIQPYQFGHPERKATCLWLKNLPPLRPTRTVKLPDDPAKRNRIHWMPPSAQRAKLRSKTYRGIARAMADQWIKHIYENKNRNIN